MHRVAMHVRRRTDPSAHVRALRAVGCGLGFLLSLTFAHIWFGGH